MVSESWEAESYTPLFMGAHADHPGDETFRKQGCCIAHAQMHQIPVASETSEVFGEFESLFRQTVPIPACCCPGESNTIKVMRACRRIGRRQTFFCFAMSQESP